MKKFIAGIIALSLICGMTACGNSESSTSSENTTATTTTITSKETTTNVNIINYADAESFESALNNGENLEGKIVQFVADELNPDSALGYNIWAGEHLNFIFSENPKVKEGNTVIIKVTKVDKFDDISWIIYCEKLDNAETDDKTISSDNTASKENKPAIEMPDLVGKDIDEVKKEYGNTFEFDIEYVTSSKRVNGYITWQSEPAGSDVFEGAPVTLRVVHESKVSENGSKKNSEEYQKIKVGDTEYEYADCSNIVKGEDFYIGDKYVYIEGEIKSYQDGDMILEADNGEWYITMVWWDSDNQSTYIEDVYKAFPEGTNVKIFGYYTNYSYDYSRPIICCTKIELDGTIYNYDAFAHEDTISNDTRTTGQINALNDAISYLKFTEFSYSGLIEQLEFEGYTHDEAVYGVDNCGADWNEQAAKCARSYLDISSFSRQELIDQLIYEGFTQEQAEYGVSAVGY